MASTRVFFQTFARPGLLSSPHLVLDRSFNKLQKFQPRTRVSSDCKGFIRVQTFHQTTKVSTEDNSFYRLQRFQPGTRVSTHYKGFIRGQASVEYDGCRSFYEISCHLMPFVVNVYIFFHQHCLKHILWILGRRLIAISFPGF